MLFTYLSMTGYISLIMCVQLSTSGDLKKTPYPWVVIVVSLAFCFIWPISLWGWLGLASKGLLKKVNEDNKDQDKKEEAEEEIKVKRIPEERWLPPPSFEGVKIHFPIINYGNEEKVLEAISMQKGAVVSNTDGLIIATFPLYAGSRRLILENVHFWCAR